MSFTLQFSSGFKNNHNVFTLVGKNVGKLTWGPIQLIL